MNEVKKNRIELVLKCLVGAVAIFAIIFGLVINKDKEDGELMDEYEELKNPNKTDIISDFVDIKYERSTEADTEFIRFSKDGSYSYYCACGNPVDNSDLCEYYTYDKENNKIELECYDGVPEKEKNIKILTATKDKLKIEINGEIREFTRTKEIEE